MKKYSNELRQYNLETGGGVTNPVENNSLADHKAATNRIIKPP
jgi:hypothetical protein